MPKLKEIKFQNPKILLWGRPGCGKTALALTLGARAQVLDCDEGLMTGMKLVDQWQRDRQEVDVIQCHESDPTKALMWPQAKMEVAKIYKQAREGKYPFKALVIDSFTALAAGAIRYIAANSGKMNEKGMVTMEASKSGGLYPAFTMPMWGLAISEVENLFTFVRALPLTVVVIFHEMTVVEEQGDREVERREISIFGRKLPGNIIRLFDEVLHMSPKPAAGGKIMPVIETVSTATMTNRTRAQLPDQTQASLGMWKILEIMGYEQ